MILSILQRMTRNKVYFHLPGYMERWWILGADSLSRNAENPQWGYVDSIRARSRSCLYQWITERFAIRLHHVLRSDTDRFLHDHPCWNISIVLKGGYWEEMPLDEDVTKNVWLGPNEATRRKWRGPGSIVFRPADARHRLVLPIGTSSWSIFIVGRKSQSWGFYTPAGKVPWREYLKSQEAA